MTAHEQETSRADQRVVDRLVPVWLQEMEQHDADEARRVRAHWHSGTLPEESARDLTTWVTARVTDTGFNEDEGPDVTGPARITPADKESVHRWLAAQGHRL
ncbi:hypothetical protein [Streptomyces glaucescens]|uniref:Uncharacterized protein n=1 Tax=Streptomyces glaucescens TaxID=1907 RepID=A0A089Z976_STRGA|nr:hypothetical protein [Streptomyces glaucescens]AIS02331.1 hypothetical protein SGLAU_31985 [Streptomyces glaucescens]